MASATGNCPFPPKRNEPFIPTSGILILTHILQSDKIKDEHVRRRGIISLVAGVQPTDVEVV
jgi:hypothetical protein